MKRFVFVLSFSFLFLKMVQGQGFLPECLGIDPKIKTAQPVQFQGTLIGIEMLPPGAPFIKELERKKLVPLFGHYYSVQVKLKACGMSEWFICSDNHFKMLDEMLERREIGTR
ncbi:MAG: hypothetical protein EOP45_06400, partial [Sphingobacteriaceae bacterium]